MRSKRTEQLEKILNFILRPLCFSVSIFYIYFKGQKIYTLVSEYWLYPFNKKSGWVTHRVLYRTKPKKS